MLVLSGSSSINEYLYFGFNDTPLQVHTSMAAFRGKHRPTNRKLGTIASFSLSCAHKNMYCKKVVHSLYSLQHDCVKRRQREICQQKQLSKHIQLLARKSVWNVCVRASVWAMPTSASWRVVFDIGRQNVWFEHYCHLRVDFCSKCNRTLCFIQYTSVSNGEACGVTWDWRGK